MLPWRRSYMFLLDPLTHSLAFSHELAYEGIWCPLTSSDPPLTNVPPLIALHLHERTYNICGSALTPEIPHTYKLSSGDAAEFLKPQH